MRPMRPASRIKATSASDTPSMNGMSKRGHRGLDRHWHDHGRQTENAQDVEDVGADHIAKRDFGLPPEGGHHRRGKFRQAGAHGDNGEADHGFGDAEFAGDLRLRP
jgi:hypothetical protein